MIRVGQNHIYIRCIYDIFGRKITIYTSIYGVYIRFWPILLVIDKEQLYANTSSKSMGRRHLRLPAHISLLLPTSSHGPLCHDLQLIQSKYETDSATNMPVEITEKYPVVNRPSYPEANTCLCQT